MIQKNILMIQNIIKSEPIRTILLYFIKIIHIIQSISLLIGPYIINNFLLLSLLLLSYIILLTCWYFFGCCFLTHIEQFLEGNIIKYEDGSVKSFITTFLENFLGSEKNVLYLITFLPLINSIFVLYKINNLYYVKKKLDNVISEQL